jgi:hypothetical protein
VSTDYAVSSFMGTMLLKIMRVVHLCENEGYFDSFNKINKMNAEKN